MKNKSLLIGLCLLLTSCSFGDFIGESSSNSNNSSSISSSSSSSSVRLPYNINIENLSIVNGYVSYNRSNLASEYEIYVDGVKTDTTDGSVYKLNITDNVQHKISVKPIPVDSFNIGVMSDEVSYAYSQPASEENEIETSSELKPLSADKSIWVYDLIGSIDMKSSVFTIPAHVNKVKISMDKNSKIKNWSISIDYRSCPIVLDLNDVCIEGGSRQQNIISSKDNHLVIIQSNGDNNMLYSRFVANNGKTGKYSALGNGGDGEDGEDGGTVINCPQIFISGSAPIYLRSTNGGNGGKGGTGGWAYNPITLKYTVKPGDGGNGGMGGSPFLCKDLYLVDDKVVKYIVGKGGTYGGQGDCNVTNVKNPSSAGIRGHDGYSPNMFFSTSNLHCDRSEHLSLQASKFISVVSNIQYDGSKITWDELEDADGYTLMIDDIGKQSTGTSYPYENDGLGHTIFVYGLTNQYERSPYTCVLNIPKEES